MPLLDSPRAALSWPQLHLPCRGDPGLLEGALTPLLCAMGHADGTGALTRRDSRASGCSLFSLPTSTFMIPFQLSPVETWKSVRKAMPKFSKVACRLMPSQGFSSLQTERREEVSLFLWQHPSQPTLSWHVPASSQNLPHTLRGACRLCPAHRWRNQDLGRWHTS